MASLGLGFQNVIGRVAAMAATTSIVARAGGQSESYLAWIFFTALAISGLGSIFQTYRVWRFGSGYAVSVVTATAFIAVCITALLEGGPAMLSSLIVVSALVQFVLISRLSLLRRIITPVVAGTVLMLLSSTIISVVLGRLSDVPEGTPLAGAPTVAAVTLGTVLGLRLFASPALQQWSPVIGILVGCSVAIPFGLFDFSGAGEAPWIGIPSNSWPGFDLSLSASFWALLPGFVIVNLAVMINSISDTVAIQQVSWRRPRATDFRVVQGAHNLVVVTNLIAALLGTLPNMIGAASSARVILTGVAARRVGVYGGGILIVAAFSPKLIALAIAIPRPAMAAYMTVMLSLLFVQGMRIVFQGGLDARKAAVVGVSLWIGVGFQNQIIFPELLSGTWETLLSNGMTTGAVSVILLTLLMELTAQRRRRLKAELDVSALPRIDAFLQEVGSKAGWNEASIDRLRSAGEETIASLLSQGDDHTAGNRQRLMLSARRIDGKIELEFMATSEEENLEDRLAYLSDEPDIQDEREMSFRPAAALRVFPAAPQVSRHRHRYRRGHRLSLASRLRAPGYCPPSWAVSCAANERCPLVAGSVESYTWPVVECCNRPLNPVPRGWQGGVPHRLRKRVCPGLTTETSLPAERLFFAQRADSPHRRRYAASPHPHRA